MVSKNLAAHPDWLGWLGENIKRGCNVAELVLTLLNSGFSEASVQHAIKAQRGGGESAPELADPQAPLRQPDFAALASPHLVSADNRYLVTSLCSPKLQLYLVQDFLTVAECDVLIDLATRAFRPSTVTIDSTPGDYRTSETADLLPGKNVTVDSIDQKIVDCMGIGLPYAETTQIQRYRVGQEFKAHTDFFAPGSDEYQTYAAEQGNRTWTFMVYLNDVERGGGTRFHNINRTITPRRGMAVVWNNRYADGAVNHDTLHAGLSVEAGEKFVITKWFRERV